MSGTANAQITDAIQQQVKTPDAHSLESIYLAATQAVGIGMQNAASAQQQSAITMQATTTQGVELLYSPVDGKTAGTLSVSPDDMLNKFETVKSKIADIKENCRTALTSVETEEQQRSVQASGFNERVHEAVNSLALSLDCLSETQYRQSLRTLQIAATARTLEELVKSPDQAKLYENVIAIIKTLV